MIDEQNIKNRPLAIEDLEDVVNVNTASISADGRLLAYVSTRVVIEENCHKDFISVVDVETNQERFLWEGSGPQWSPVSNEIAYLAEDDALTYIWLFSLADGEKRRIAPVFESNYFMGHLALQNFAWSPNGLQIAYISTMAPKGEKEVANVKVIDRLLYKSKGGRGRPVVTEDELSHLWLVPVSGGEPTVLTAGNFNEHSLSWSPDSSEIAFVSNRSSDPDNNQLHDLWSVHVRSENITRYTKDFGTVSQPSWSADGKNIAFLATLSKVATNDSPAEDTQLYILSTADQSVRCLTKSFDRRVEQITWHPRSDTIFFTAGNNGTTAIFKVDVDTGAVEHVVGDNCRVLEYSVSSAGNTICYVSTDTNHLAEIFLFDNSLHTGKKITNSTNAILQKCQLQHAESFWFKSFDDQDVQGWLIKPAAFSPGAKYPMVLVIHGGPHNMFGYEFEDRMQLLSAEGYGVLFINPRGSSGYGQSFSKGSMLNWGGGDYKDLMAGIDEAIKQHNWIDVNRLGVTGQSYGGYMTNWIITQTNRFKAAVVDGGISNLVSFAGTSLYHSLIEAEFNGSAYDNFPLLWQWSPLRNVKNVTTPTLFLHGEVDNEVPLSQAEEMYIALKKMGVESRFVQYVGEGHGWRPDLKPRSRQDLLRRTLEWFNKYLAR